MVGSTTTRSFQYDAAGNITADTRTGVGTYNYTYNHANRMSTVKLGTQNKGTYTYDGLNRLARRIVENTAGANGNRHYIYDLYGNLIVEADDFGNTVREYIWLAQDIATATQKTGVVPGFRPIAVVDDVDTASPKTYHVHVDHVNRPVLMTDSTKTKVWEANYLPFGGVNTITGSASLNARFPGQWFQLESGLHYNWHRHYDATIARFTQPDPLGFIDGPSVYAYVTNSPQVFTDPDGRVIPIIPIIIGTAVGIALDIATDSFLESQGCSCQDNQVPGDTAINVVAGAALGDFAKPSFSKPFSSEKTSGLSRILFGPRGRLRKRIGNFIPRKGPGILGAAAAGVNFYKIGKCLLNK